MSLPTDQTFPFTSTSGTSYTLTISSCIDPTSLRLSIDDHSVLSHTHDPSAGFFVGEFGKQYIEEITRKTGSFKKFPIFLTMLLSSLEDDDSSRSEGGATLSLDVLTSAELTSMSRTKQPNKPQPKVDPTKRYCILTYKSEYDRVHYPLPCQEALVTVEVMKRRFQRLVKEGNVTTAVTNANLNSTAPPPPERSPAPSPSRDAEARSSETRRENAELRRKLKDWERKYAAEITISKKEIRDLKGQIESLPIGKESASRESAGSGGEVTTLMNKLKQVSKQLEARRRTA